MTRNTISSRRAFLKGAAVVAGPVAAVGAAAVGGVNEHQARIARLEAEASIRALHQDWLRKVNTGDRVEAAKLHEAVVRVSADHEGAADEIRLAADGTSAEGRFHLVVETETARPLDSTLARMAASQGEGMVRSSARQLVRASYAKTEKGWEVRRLELQDV